MNVNYRQWRIYDWCIVDIIDCKFYIYICRHICTSIYIYIIDIHDIHILICNNTYIDPIPIRYHQYELASTAWVCCTCSCYPRRPAWGKHDIRQLDSKPRDGSGPKTRVGSLIQCIYIYMYVYIPIYPPWDQRFAPNNGWLGDDPLLSFWDGVLSGRWYVKFQGGFFWFSWRCYPWAVSKNIWTGKNWVATWPGNIYIYIYTEKNNCDNLRLPDKSNYIKMS